MNLTIKHMQKLYDEIKLICKPDAYNLMLHKHLGDVFYAIAAKPFFEAQYDDAPLRFIIRPQHEFLMKMFGITDYAVYDMQWFEQIVTNKDYHYLPKGEYKSYRFDVFCKNTFNAIPMKNIPFIIDGDMNIFHLYDKYWCYRWLDNVGVTTNLKFMVPKYKPDLSETAEQKLQQIAPLDKIVLFAPEAATFKEFDAEFWNIIADAVHAKGYTIIVNSKKFKINHSISAFDLDLSLEDVIALGFNCAYVFALRSGLCDVLVGAGKRLYTFYPAMARRELYSLSYPFVQKTGVHEFQIFNWKIDKVVWEDIDLTEKLQEYIDKLHKSYVKETVKRILSNRTGRCNHSTKRNLLRELGGVSKKIPDNNVQNPVPILNITLRPLYTKCTAVHTWGTETKYSYLGGILTHKKDSQGAQRMRFCGITVYSQRNTKCFRTTRLFGIPLYKTNLTKKLLNTIWQNIDDKHDDIYIIRHNIGETYIYLSHLKNWIKKNGSKNPLLLVWRQKDIPLYQMFINNDVTLQYVNISQQEFDRNLTEEYWEYKGKRFFCPTPDILANIIKQRQNVPDWNFYKHICHDLTAAYCDKLPDPKIPHYATESVAKKIKIYIKRPFVILAPNANSLQQMPTSFWNKIIYQLRTLGYDVFINSHSMTADDIHDFDLSETITFDCDLAEIYELSKHAAGLITLASGLSVFLTASECKIDLIYTDFKTTNPVVRSCVAKEIYSVHHIPGIDKTNVQEYDAGMYPPDELADIILSRYQK